ALKDPNSDVRYYVVLTLGRMQAREALDGLVPLLKDLEPRVAEAAFNALADMGDRRFVPKLLEFIDDEQSAYRRVAISRIGDFRDGRALGPLLKLVKGGGSLGRSAIVSLGGLGDPDALDALKPLAASLDASISQLAKEAVKSIEDHENPTI